MTASRGEPGLPALHRRADRVAGEVTRTMDGPSSQVTLPAKAMINIGGQWYEQVSERRCYVCQLARRNDVERWALSGCSPSQIVRLLGIEEEDGDELRALRRRIGRHLKNHSPIPVIRATAIAMAKLSDSGDDFDSIVSSYVTSHVMAQGIIERGWDMLQNERIRLTMSDVLGAMKWVSAESHGASGAEQMAIFNQMTAVMLAAFERHMDPGDFMTVMNEMNQSKVVATLIEKARALNVAEIEAANA